MSWSPTLEIKNQDIKNKNKKYTRMRFYLEMCAKLWFFELTSLHKTAQRFHFTFNYLLLTPKVLDEKDL